MARISFFLGIGQQHRFGVFSLFFFNIHQIDYSAYNNNLLIISIHVLYRISLYCCTPAYMIYLCIGNVLYKYSVSVLCRLCPNIYNCMYRVLCTKLCLYTLNGNVK